MFTVYGIPNCNTVKKALTHLEQNGIDFEFISFKKVLPNESQIKEWKKAFGDWPVNKKGPTYRKIKEAFESANALQKTHLLISNTSAIKRPIVMKDDKVLAFGYDEDTYNNIK